MNTGRVASSRKKHNNLFSNLFNYLVTTKVNWIHYFQVKQIFNQKLVKPSIKLCTVVCVLQIGIKYTIFTIVAALSNDALYWPHETPNDLFETVIYGLYTHGELICNICGITDIRWYWFWFKWTLKSNVAVCHNYNYNCFHSMLK